MCRLDRWRWQTKMNARLKQLGQPNIPDMQIHPLFFLPPLKNPPPSLTHGVRGKQKHRIRTHLRTAIQNLLHAKAQVIWTVAGILRAVLSAFHLDSFTAVTSRDCGSFCFVLDDCVKIQQLSEIMVIEVMQQCSNRITECRGRKDNAM